MYLEFERDHRKLRFSFKLNRRNEQELKKATFQVDKLEMDNYNLMEQISDLLRQYDDQKQTVQDVLAMLDRDSIGQLTINEQTRLLLSLIERITATQQKYQQGGNSVQEEDMAHVMTNNESAVAKRSQQDTSNVQTVRGTAEMMIYCDDQSQNEMGMVGGAQGEEGWKRVRSRGKNIKTQSRTE